MKFGVYVLKDYMFCYAKITVKNNIQFSCIGLGQGIGFIINYRIETTFYSKSIISLGHRKKFRNIFFVNNEIKY